MPRHDTTAEERTRGREAALDELTMVDHHEQQQLALIARAVRDLPPPEIPESAWRRARNELQTAMNHDAYRRRWFERGIPLARVAAMFGVASLAAASLGGAYAMGARLPDRVGVGPLAALTESHGTVSVGAAAAGRADGDVLGTAEIEVDGTAVASGFEPEQATLESAVSASTGFVAQVSPGSIVLQDGDSRMAFVVRTDTYVFVNGELGVLSQVDVGSVARVEAESQGDEQVAVSIEVHPAEVSVRVDGAADRDASSGGVIADAGVDVDLDAGSDGSSETSIAVDAGARTSVTVVPPSINAETIDAGATVTVEIDAESGEVARDPSAPDGKIEGDLNLGAEGDAATSVEAPLPAAADAGVEVDSTVDAGTGIAIESAPDSEGHIVGEIEADTSLAGSLGLE